MIESAVEWGCFQTPGPHIFVFAVPLIYKVWIWEFGAHITLLGGINL